MNSGLVKRRLIEQRQDVEKILAQPLVERENLGDYRRALRTAPVKVIVGPRRCGKTILALQGLEGLKHHYVNFDDEVLGLLRREELNVVLELLVELFGETDILLLDEIQNIRGWELFVNRLHRSGRNVVLTGSNSRLMSRELGQVLTGRTLTIRMFPFSFREYLGTDTPNETDSMTTSEVGLIRARLTEYLDEGGFPEVVLGMPDSELKRRYLRELFDATVSRDVLQRYRVRNAAELAGFANLLASSFSRRVSIRRMSRAVGLSEHTLTRYASYLEEACLVLSCPKYSMKARESVRSLRKYYLVDTGFVTAKRLTSTPDVGLRMENVVAVELARRGLGLHHYLARDRYEVDFVILEGRKVDRVVQVSSDETGLRERETRHGIMAAEELGTPRLDVITWLHEGQETHGAIEVTYVPLWKWLLQSQREE